MFICILGSFKILIAQPDWSGYNWVDSTIWMDQQTRNNVNNLLAGNKSNKKQKNVVISVRNGWWFYTFLLQVPTANISSEC